MNTRNKFLSFKLYLGSHTVLIHLSRGEKNPFAQCIHVVYTTLLLVTVIVLLLFSLVVAANEKGMMRAIQFQLERRHRVPCVAR